MSSAEPELRDVEGVPVVWLSGVGEQEIVGESHYQDAIERVVGPKTRDGHADDVVAYLVPEPENPHSTTGKAVRVELRGEKVGYLPRGADVAWQPLVVSLMESHGRPVACAATVRGGWRRKKRGGRPDEGHFGVTLYLPPRPGAAPIARAAPAPRTPAPAPVAVAAPPQFTSPQIAPPVASAHVSPPQFASPQIAPPVAFAYVSRPQPPARASGWTPVRWALVIFAVLASCAVLGKCVEPPPAAPPPVSTALPAKAPPIVKPAPKPPMRR